MLRTPANKLLGWCALSAFLITATPVMGQGFSGLLSGNKNTPGAPAGTDPFKRTTPRSAIYEFLQACHDNNFSLAAQYLDLSKLPKAEQATQGQELARELGELLDRNPQFEINRLNDTPEGNVSDGLSPDLDNLAAFSSKGHIVTLQMQRVMHQGMGIWKVSADSVSHIAQLNAEAAESPIEKRIPEPLIRIKLIGTSLWVWLALVLIALILSLLSRILSRILIAVLKPLAKRYAKSVQAYRLEAFMEPLRLLLSIFVFRACMEVIAPSALARTYIIGLLTLLFILGVTSVVMRVVDVISDQVTSRLDPRQRALSYSVIPLFVRIVKIFIFCLAVLTVLSQWGYSTSTILAGVGVGGLAVALAAQKTIENLFGGISIITDRPVLVGDVCQFGTQVGTVEDIGLRSTRIRTPDRTVVTIPNSVFSTMTLENFSKRDRMLFHPTLPLRRDTTAEQIGGMMEAVTAILQQHPLVDASGVPLRFTKISNDAFSLEIFAYVLTADGNEYLRVQSVLLLKILETASRLNVGFAVPFQESLVLPSAGGPNDFRRASEEPRDGAAVEQSAARAEK